MGKRITAENRGKTAAKRTMPVGRRFVKGQSGNPGGRPRTSLLSQAVRQRLSELVPDDPDGRTYAQKIADALVSRAAKGDAESFRAVGDRAEGKPAQAVSITSATMFSDFDGWTRGELRRFAESGVIPERFAQTEGSDETQTT